MISNKKYKKIVVLGAGCRKSNGRQHPPPPTTNKQTNKTNNKKTKQTTPQPHQTKHTQKNNRYNQSIINNFQFPQISRKPLPTT